MGLKLKNFMIKDIDKGWKERRKRLETTKGRRVTVGVHGEDAGGSSAGRTAQAGRDLHGRFIKKGTSARPESGTTGVTNVMIGTWAEYGTATEPERSWLRSTMDANKKKYADMLRSLAIQIVDGKMTAGKAMAILGEAVKADMVNTINQGIPPPNSPETIARKGSSKPLIDTASFKQSIDYAVQQAAKGGGEHE